MSAKTFTKGQAVTLFQSWDRKGTIRVVDLTVHSCGAERMILVDANGVKFEGRNFQAAVVQGVNLFTEVHPRMTAEAAQVHALAMGADVVAFEKNHFETMIAHYGYPETHGYNVSMRSHAAELHEPRVVRE